MNTNHSLSKKAAFSGLARTEAGAGADTGTRAANESIGESSPAREKKDNRPAAGDGVMSVAASRRLAALILDIAEMILVSGGEAGRVEDTAVRIGTAYGFRKTDIFTMSSIIILTVEDSHGNHFTLSRRIRSISNDMERVRACNELSRRICAHPVPEEELRGEIARLSGTAHYSEPVVIFGHMLVASCMAVFFGGSCLDVPAAALAAPVVYYVLKFCRKAGLLNFVSIFLDSFAVGLLIYFLMRVGLGVHYDKIAMGNIMLLIPGTGLTTAVRDMINGDIMTGIIGLINALLQAAAIAMGFVAAFIVLEH